MFKSITFKLVIQMFVFLVGLYFVQLIVINHIADESYLKFEKKEMNQLYERISHVLDNHDDLEIAMSHIQEDEDIHVRVMTTESYDHYFEKEIFLDQATSFIKENKMTGKDSLYLIGRYESSEIYYIILDSPLTAMHKTLSYVNELLIRSFFLVVLIGGAMAWFLGQKFTKPIKEIEEVAVKVSNLDFSEKLNPVGDDEIGRLKCAINLMNDSLSDLFNDINDLNKQLTDDIHHHKSLDDMRRDFIANVSHELKSPLALMSMYSENLKNIEGIDKDFYCDVIISECYHMNLLVKELLTVSKLENDMMAYQMAEVNLSLMVDKIIEKKKLLFKKNDLRIEVNHDKSFRAWGDVFYLEQVLSNYLDNALAYADKSTKIIVELTKVLDGLKLEVTNDGPVLNSHEQDKIWDSFYRMDNARTPTDDHHVGLGLYVVKRIIEAHRGRSGCSSHEKGMSFYFILPDRSLNELNIQQTETTGI